MRRQCGFSYVVVMFLVAVLSIFSVRALEFTSTAERREKEVDLLWAGMAFRNAIAVYRGRGDRLPGVTPPQLPGDLQRGGENQKWDATGYH